MPLPPQFLACYYTTFPETPQGVSHLSSRKTARAGQSRRPAAKPLPEFFPDIISRIASPWVDSGGFLA